LKPFVQYPDPVVILLYLLLPSALLSHYKEAAEISVGPSSGKEQY